MNIIEVIEDVDLLGKLFPEKESWSGWFAFLKALFALEMNDEELELYRQCTGRTDPPKRPFQESYVIGGRRQGKSFMSAVIAVYLALFRDWTPFLNVGEVSSLLVVGPDRFQSANTLRYIKQILHEIPLFKEKIVSERAMDISLSTRCQIMVKSCNYATVRGFSMGAVIAEELSFWRSDTGVHIDSEVINALMPGMATFKDQALFCGISSPYGRQGHLYNVWRDYWGNEEQDRVLVWHSPTRTMNPQITEEYIQQQLERDPEAGRAEWLAEFRMMLESFLPLEWIERATVNGRDKLEVQPGISYAAHVDMSGGVVDYSVLCIGHRENDQLIMDILEAVPAPHSPQKVICRFAEILKTYRIYEVSGDRYSANFVKDAFEAEGIRYTASDQNASELFIEFGGLLSAGRVEILDDQKLFGELRLLERKPGRGGRDRVGHPSRGHDDHAVACAGAMVKLSKTWPNTISFDLLQGGKNRVIN